MNLEQSKQKMLGYILELTNRGVLTPAAKNADYIALHNQKADAEQKFLATIKKLHAVKRISQTPVNNLLPTPLYQFDVVQHTNSDLIYAAKGAKAYYFEVDDVADIYIEEETSKDVWAALTTINHSTNIGEFTAYKGFIEASGVNNNIRIRFSGENAYNTRYRALYGLKFSSLDRIPPLTRYNLYKMPNDFYQLEKVVLKGNQAEMYKITTNYYWENTVDGKYIAINYYDTGEYSIFYSRFPTAITDSTPDSTEYEVDIDAQELIPLACAIGIIPQDKLTLAGFLTDQYRFKLAQLQNADNYSTPEIKNTVW